MLPKHTMRKTLLLLGFVLCALISNAQYKAYTIQATVSLTTDSLLIVNGDTIGHFHSLGTDTIVDKSYIDALFTGTYVEFGDSVITFVTPAQLSDSLNSLPGGHDAVTLAASATNGGLSLVGQQIGFQAASTSLAGYLTSGNFNLFNNKLSYVSHDETLSGNGTTGSPLSADTSVVALRTWVESQNYVTSVYLSYDSLSDTPTIPEISNLAYGPGWDDNLDGASKNAIYDAIQSVGGGGATNLTYSATPDSGVVNSDTGTDATIPAGSTVNASLMLPEDKEYLDVVDDSLGVHRTAINTSISDISDLSDSVDVFRPLIDANTGKDTTGIYHTNRALLDAISASDLDSNFVSLHTDTLFLGADTLVEVTDIGDLVFSILKTDTLVIGGDTIINFDLDTTNISGLQTFVETHSIGSFTETDPTVTTYTKGLTSASALLTEIKTVDGSTSGLDADLLDNISSNRFVYGDDETANIHYTGDLNSITKSGFYYASGTSTNRPSGESDGYLITNQWANNANYQVQYFTPYDATKFYLRRKLYTGSWGSWVEVTGGSGSTTFIGLTDTPSSFTADKWLKVNSGGTALEFINSPITAVSGAGSVETSGTTSISVTLDGDLTTPGNSKYYGTNISGTRGWYSLPSGVGDMTKAVYDADENNTIDAIRGGTGQSGYTTGDLLYANSTVTLAKLNAGTSGYVLTSNGAGSAPSWQASGSSKWTDNGDIIYPTNSEDVRITNETPGLFFVDSNSDDISINVNNGTFYIYDDTNNNLLFSTQTTDGSIVLGDYGSGSITGTAAYNLQVASDGTIIETAVAGGSGWSYAVQSLSTTTPTLNANSGLNAKITLTGNTDITFSNLSVGMTGNLTVTNAASAYTLEFSGYTFKIAPSLNSSAGVITMSGSSAIDVLSWYYDGTYVIINGTLDYD